MSASFSHSGSSIKLSLVVLTLLSLMGKVSASFLQVSVEELERCIELELAPLVPDDDLTLFLVLIGGWSSGGWGSFWSPLCLLEA